MQYPKGELSVIYYRFQDGTVGYLEGEGPSIPEGAEQISEEIWKDAMEGWEAARKAREEADRADRDSALKNAYQELRTLGLSDAAARAVSGYAGPA